VSARSRSKARDPVAELAEAVRAVERDHPLPRCVHDNALQDHSGEKLEPTCGCGAPPLADPPRVPIDDFGADHWSTFGYIETRIVDHGGVPLKHHLRCVIRRHPFFAHEGGDASRYPTRLRGDRKLANHDDWDCLDDLEAAGLLENRGTGANPVFCLTPRGEEIAGKLRAHKGRGGNWSEFFIEPVVAT
jgi:hypothetical protein